MTEQNYERAVSPAPFEVARHEATLGRVSHASLRLLYAALWGQSLVHSILQAISSEPGEEEYTSEFTVLDLRTAIETHDEDYSLTASIRFDIIQEVYGDPTQLIKETVKTQRGTEVYGLGMPSNLTCKVKPVYNRVTVTADFPPPA